MKKSETEKKMSGHWNAGVGKLKSAAGRLLNDRNLERKGQTQKLRGEAQKAVSATKSAVKAGVDRARRAP